MYSNQGYRVHPVRRRSAYRSAYSSARRKVAMLPRLDQPVFSNANLAHHAHRPSLWRLELLALVRPTSTSNPAFCTQLSFRPAHRGTGCSTQKVVSTQAGDAMFGGGLPHGCLRFLPDLPFGSSFVLPFFSGGLPVSSSVSTSSVFLPLRGERRSPPALEELASPFSTFGFTTSTGAAFSPPALAARPRRAGCWTPASQGEGVSAACPVARPVVHPPYALLCVLKCIPECIPDVYPVCILYISCVYPQCILSVS